MRVVVCHSDKDRCGVREYGRQLDASLRRAGAEVVPLTYASLGDAQAVVDRVLLVHFELGLVHPVERFAAALSAVRARGARVVWACHMYDRGQVAQFEGLFDHLVLHRDYPERDPRSAVIPLGCPLYEEPGDRASVRARLGLPLDKTVVSTIGFLTAWKRLPEIAEVVLRKMAPHPELFLRVHAPHPFDDASAKIDDPKLRAMVTGNMSFTTEFLSEREALNLAWASDVGFLYHGFHTHSVSAAAKQYVSARRPLVVTASTHVSDLQQGILRVQDSYFEAFADAVVALALNGQHRQILMKGMESEYERLNMDAVARQYVKLFEEVTA